MEVENTKQCIAAGLKYINDSYGSEGFKIQWGRTPFTYLHDIVVFTPTLKGYMAYIVAGTKLLVDRTGIRKKLQNLRNQIVHKIRRSKKDQSPEPSGKGK